MILSNMNILLICEEKHLVALILHWLFKDTSFDITKVDIATTSDEAKKKAENGEYDLVIVDGTLGDTSGSALIDTILAIKNPGLPYILMSGKPALECEWLLKKPFHPKEFLEMVTKRLSTTKAA